MSDPTIEYCKKCGERQPHNCEHDQQQPPAPPESQESPEPQAA